MKVTILGAAKEVGRSGFLVDVGNKKILMDYGVLLKRDREPAFPLHVKPKDIDAVILTHAHLDHSGFVPSLFLSDVIGLQALGTAPTFDLSYLLIEDMIKISGFYLPFEYLDLLNMKNHSRELRYREPYLIDGVQISLFNSGHVLGGATITISHENKRIFYTGDINTRGSKLLRPADLDIGEINLIIMESTYSQSNQTPREESERDLMNFANGIIEDGGTVFIPAFSVERAQEIACVLQAHNFLHKVVMDGMALKANEIMLKHPSFLRDPDTFKEAITRAEWIRGWNRRKKVVNEPCAIISPAGMLVGGSAVHYMQELCKNERNGIALVSYQGEGTPGRMLLERGVLNFQGKVTKCHAAIRQFDFSGHNSRPELFEILNSVKGSPEVLTVHGDGKACTEFAREIQEKYGFKAHAPEVGEAVQV
ncbi:MAG TPA: MBL fold metallo-hydrolase [Nitrososphaeraceae archaeon]|nr:MBL fold metallo-hydrolase [Nitrososphaeraceae archaeon]